MRHSRPGWRATFAAAVLLLACAGCTTVRIQVADRKDVEVRQLFGIAAVEVQPGAGVLLESRSLGATRSIDGFVLGYHSASLATLPPGRCQLVVWVTNEAQVKELASLLGGRGDVCVLQPERKLGEKQ